MYGERASLRISWLSIVIMTRLLILKVNLSKWLKNMHEFSKATWLLSSSAKYMWMIIVFSVTAWCLHFLDKIWTRYFSWISGWVLRCTHWLLKEGPKLVNAFWTLQPVNYSIFRSTHCKHRAVRNFCVQWFRLLTVVLQVQLVAAPWRHSWCNTWLCLTWHLLLFTWLCLQNSSM